MARKKVVTIGGGTGQEKVLSALVKASKWDLDLDITAIVSVGDSGSSSGIIRKETGVIPPGDIRQCLLALAGEYMPDDLRSLLKYRFNGEADTLGDHSIGNLIIAGALLRMGVTDGMNFLHKFFHVPANHRVWPVSDLPVTVLVKDSQGKLWAEEGVIDSPTDKPRTLKSVQLAKPIPMVLESARRAICDASVIVFGPGDLFTSILPTILVEGMQYSIAHKSAARRVFVANIMTKNTETHGFKLSDFVRILEEHVGAKMHYIIVNIEESIPEVLAAYAKEGKSPVPDDLPKDLENPEADVQWDGRRIVRAAMVHPAKKAHHDSVRLAEVIKNILL